MIKLFEKYTELKDIKDMLILRAAYAENLDLVKFFVERGYNINADKLLDAATWESDIFKYLLEKGSDIEKIGNDRLRDINVQKILIDHEHVLFVYDRVGFNRQLENDPKYKEIIDMVEYSKDYNI